MVQICHHTQPLALQLRQTIDIALNRELFVRFNVIDDGSCKILFAVLQSSEYDGMLFREVAWFAECSTLDEMRQCGDDDNESVVRSTSCSSHQPAPKCDRGVSLVVHGHIQLANVDYLSPDI